MQVWSWRYRVRQLGRAVRERHEPIPHELVTTYLDGRAQELFYSMAPRDQAHSAKTAALIERSETDCAGAELIVAALLHDTGKGRQQIWQRVTYVLLRALPAGALSRLARPGDGTRGAFYRSLRHPQLGADLARTAGCSARVCSLIAEHHGPSREPALRLLQWADDVV